MTFGSNLNIFKISDPNNSFMFYKKRSGGKKRSRLYWPFLESVTQKRLFILKKYILKDLLLLSKWDIKQNCLMPNITQLQGLLHAEM